MCKSHAQTGDGSADQHNRQTACLASLLFADLLRGAAFAPGIASSSEDKNQGVIVERVPKDSEAERAGLQNGDVIFGWARGEEKGKVDSPFALLDVEADQAPHGTLILQGSRNSEPRTWSLGQDDWSMTTAPQLPEPMAAKYREGQELFKAGKLAEAAARWRDFLTAQMWSDTKQWDAADHAYRETIDMAREAGPRLRIQLLRAWGSAFQRRGDWVAWKSVSSRS